MVGFEGRSPDPAAEGCFSGRQISSKCWCWTVWDDGSERMTRQLSMPRDCVVEDDNLVDCLGVEMPPCADDGGTKVA